MSTVRLEQKERAEDRPKRGGERGWGERPPAARLDAGMQRRHRGSVNERLFTSHGKCTPTSRRGILTTFSVFLKKIDHSLRGTSPVHHFGELFSCTTPGNFSRAPLQLD
ncbi:hypothetical protein EVAR_33227_1 [Eumeta japonica]|uniref:Uncharacterized protein n=1 Tax=Eumeta variegata TaxID=151549 RepID=A0A4C1W3I8_EUMVA|nr:hypothetical protein EVAR_33227_1 [Eumeta japonica]